MNNEIDLLQIKIDKAKENLPKETLDAIAGVDWKAAILALREKKGYSFEQLGDLETETELLMCGLLPPADYPKELEARMHISRAEANELVNIMNDTVFRKIKEEMIKNSERNKIFEETPPKIQREVRKPPMSTQINQPPKPNLNQPELEPARTTVQSGGAPKGNMDAVMKSAGIELENKGSVPPDSKVAENREDILKKVENPIPTITPIGNGPSSMFRSKIMGDVKIDVAKTEHENSGVEAKSSESKPKIDPYREIPE